MGHFCNYRKVISNKLYILAIQNILLVLVTREKRKRSAFYFAVNDVRKTKKMKL